MSYKETTALQIHYLMDNYNHELHDMKTSWSQNYIMLRDITLSEMRTIKQ
jgi:hypothetical protein